MKEAGLFAVVYDIASNRERYRVDRILKGYGFRVQKSVFECRLGKADKSRLIAEIMKLNVLTGSIKIYRVYGGSENIVLGKPMSSPDADFAYVL